VRSAARRALGAHARLLYTERPPVSLLLPALAPVRPPKWPTDPQDPSGLYTHDPGTLRGRIRVPRAGRYRVWIGGAFGREVDVRIDGRAAGSVSDEPGERERFFALGSIALSGGTHRVELARLGNRLRAGDGNDRKFISRLVLVPNTSAPPPVHELDPRDYKRLCGRRIDWVEVVRR
jgi:hypothetical protein